MKRSAEADIRSILDGFLSQTSSVRRKSTEALQRLQTDDPGSLAAALATRIASREASAEARSLAAVLLRKVFQQIPSVLVSDGTGEGGSQAMETVDSGPRWCRQGLGELLMEALTASVCEPHVRRQAADLVATAAAVQFSCGRAWPDLASLLARWCSSGHEERAAVLQILELLQDEAEEREQSNTGNGTAPRAWLYALLDFMKDADALHALLRAELLNKEDEVSCDAAARIYLLCVASPQVPAALQAAVKDLAATLAEAIVQSGSQPREACVQAVALAARADPGAWACCAAAPSEESSLPATLARTAMDATAEKAVRTAALQALLELLAALDGSSGLEGIFDAEASGELLAHATAVVASALAELPSDEATDAWAEIVDGEAADPESEGDAEDLDTFLEASLDAAQRLAARDGEARLILEAAAQQLLLSEVWQARHGGLLVLLRLAAVDSEEEPQQQAASKAAEAALLHLGHVHPRVRWAALEVLARLLSMQLCEPLQLLEKATDTLLAVPGDSYSRVRRRGLLVLLLASAQLSSCLPPQLVDQLFRRVLIPQVRSQEPDVCQACVAIAQNVSAGMGSDKTAERGPFADLQAELQQALSEGACGEASDSIQDGKQAVQIEWPMDWRLA